MDRAFIENNQILERYLTGKLPFKGAQDFEQYCREHPEVLDEVKFGERVNAGLRLLEAAGRPVDWQEPKPAWWRRWETTAALGIVCLGLTIWLYVLSDKQADAKKQIAALQQSAQEGPLLAPNEVQTIALSPDRNGPGGPPLATIHTRNPPSLVEMRLNVSYAKQTTFRITLSKKDDTRIGTAYNLLRDSNGELRLSFNSSALHPGEYKLAIVGIPFRGNPVPVGWATLRAVE
jgi:hypothetical protein